MIVTGMSNLNKVNVIKFLEYVKRFDAICDLVRIIGDDIITITFFADNEIIFETTMINR